jgi:hypothetical protein
MAAIPAGGVVAPCQSLHRLTLGVILLCASGRSPGSQHLAVNPNMVMSSEPLLSISAPVLQRERRWQLTA